MEKFIKTTKTITKGMLLACLVGVIALLVYRILFGPNESILKLAIILTCVAFIANFVNKRIEEWTTNVVAYLKTLLK